MDEARELDPLRTAALTYIQKWIGTPYKYGGDDFSGFDCSGLIVETLQSIGRISPFQDFTAHDLYLEFKNGHQVDIPYAGCLVFWFREGKARHVAMLINSLQVIEAGGGGTGTLTEEDAIRHNAYVRIRRLNYRGDGYKIIDPFKDWDWEA
jgi:cell wall-associated NlpC family hydrolase